MLFTQDTVAAIQPVSSYNSKHDNFCIDARNQIIMFDLGSAQRINTLNVEILQTARFSINQRQKLYNLFAARPHHRAARTTFAIETEIKVVLLSNGA